MLALTPYPRISSGSKRTQAARIADPLSREGAEELARRIKDYWRGRNVTVSVVPVSKVHGECLGYCVRSDMVNGLPVG